MDGFAEPKDKLILIVEDDEGMRDFLEMAIAREGFRTTVAASGTDALAKVAGSPPALILLDLMLPDRGGYEVARELQQQEEVARIPIVMLTARRMDSRSIAMMRQEPNVADYLEKPVKPQILAATLHRLLKTSPPTRV